MKFADVTACPCKRIIMCYNSRERMKSAKNDYCSALFGSVDSVSEASEYDSVPGESL